MVSSSPVLFELTDHVGIITLNRPEALNAVNAELSSAMGETLRAAASDPDVRALVVTGRGRSFCAGADLKQVAQGRSIMAPGHPEWGFAGFVRHWVPQPVIAAVNGFAMGGGTEIVLACDLAVAGEQATFGLPEVKRGIIAAAGGVVRLQRQVPLKRALEVALTGDSIDAATALEWGLLNRVVDQDSVLETAVELAAKIAANAPVSVQQTKRVIHETAASGSEWDPEWSAEDPWEVSIRARNTVMATEDSKEGPKAFSEKRVPTWQGR